MGPPQSIVQSSIYDSHAWFMCQTNVMNVVRAVEGDITKQKVDAIVNAANTQMRGGGGVDGAIHRAAGPELLEECIAKFPNGLATSQAGWTWGYDLPARYVIHVPGPNYGAGQTDPALLRDAYRSCLEVADELSVDSIAFPLLSAGVYRWPLDQAISIAVETLATVQTKASQVLLVSPTLAGQISQELKRIGM